MGAADPGNAAKGNIVNARGAELVGNEAAPTVAPNTGLSPRIPPLPAKAKHVIHIFADGGPSHVDTVFDPQALNPGNCDMRTRRCRD